MKRIALLAWEVIPPNGEHATQRGGDRYVLELCNLIRDMGHKPVIFQRSGDEAVSDKPGYGKAKPAWRSEWYGYDVFGIPAPAPDDLNQEFAKDSGRVDAAVYITVPLSIPLCHPRAVAISHGIQYDWPLPQAKFDPRLYTEALAGLSHGIVSVDANTINAVAACTQGRFRHRFRHIPNFVDTKTFKPSPRKADGKVRVLFARSLQPFRGLNHFIAAVDRLAAKHPNMEVWVCGRAHASAEAEVQRWTEKRPWATWLWKPYEEMPAVYQACDINVVPTLGAEGTALSLLEGMACGLPCITTHVGGLAELVHDGFNGRLIAPDANALTAAIEDLVLNPDKRRKMGQQAREVAKTYDLSLWRERWSAVIGDLTR